MRGISLFLAILIFQQVSAIRSQNVTVTKECIPGLDYRQDCNRCWCLSDGNILVCDKMDCKALPRKMWAKVKLKKLTEKDRALELEDIAKKAGVFFVEKVTGQKVNGNIKQVVFQFVKEQTTSLVKQIIKVKVLPYVLNTVQQAAQGVFSAIKKAVYAIGNAIKNTWNRFTGGLRRFFG